MANDAWTPAVLNKMKAFLARGLSTAESGKKIGMSKNAVVGKLNRLGWNAKSQESPKKKIAPPPAKLKKPVAPARPPAKKTPAKPAPKPTVKSVAKGKSATDKPVPKGKVAAAPKSTLVKAMGGRQALKAPAIKSNSKTLAMHQRIIQHSLEMAALRPDQCRWPIGDPDSANFHFCGKQAFVGKPYCYEHCLQAYQMQPPKKK